jgi:predicted RNase H-like HicB family nuclease
MIFHATLEQAEDGWIVVECPALPGCVSQGIDENEALENIKEADAIEYVVERLLKLKPVRKQSLINSIKAMFQFQGGISDSDTDKIISELQKRKHIKVEQNKVFYL